MSRCVSLYQALANASLNLPQHHRKGPPQGDSINSLGRGCYPCARHADCGWHAHVRTRRLWAEGFAGTGGTWRGAWPVAHWSGFSWKRFEMAR